MYHMTVYDLNGDVLYDQAIDAKSDDEAKEIGFAWLAEHDHKEKAHRIINAKGRLISFKPHQVHAKTGKSTEKA
ncbi:hypothetical protein IC619_003835 [Hazenella sp. IB182353]|uniref:YhzD family protein n=1 Tax=Polycladospora coralii TaxID=2771432 RepID=UPI001745E123|nr:YhzD family protein [Polycladospora coralii]MBS7529625.1 hypothetical protein [Polycladospora coralii]